MLLKVNHAHYHATESVLYLEEIISNTPSENREHISASANGFPFHIFVTLVLYCMKTVLRNK